MSMCPCQSELKYAECCEPFHLGKKNPDSAEKLMRSRYSAFALSLPDYIVETTHPDHRDKGLLTSVTHWMSQTVWQGLEVLGSDESKDNDAVGTVEFVAHYTEAERTLKHHEMSKFRLVEDKWLFCDGEVYAG